MDWRRARGREFGVDNCEEVLIGLLVCAHRRSAAVVELLAWSPEIHHGFDPRYSSFIEPRLCGVCSRGDTFFEGLELSLASFMLLVGSWRAVIELAKVLLDCTERDDRRSWR